VLTIRSRWYWWLFGSCHAARNARMHCWCSLIWAPRMISPRPNAGPMQCARVSIALPLKTSRKVIEDSRGREKSGVARLFVFPDMQNVQESGAVKGRYPWVKQWALRSARLHRMGEFWSKRATKAQEASAPYHAGGRRAEDKFSLRLRSATICPKPTWCYSCRIYSPARSLGHPWWYS
jgi:hypothetical protein